MIVYPIRVYPCGVYATVGGEGSVANRKVAGTPHPPKKWNQLNGDYRLLQLKKVGMSLRLWSQ